MKVLSLSLVLMVGLAATSMVAGDVILYDDAVQNGMGLFNATDANAPVYEGTQSLKMDRGAFSEAGLIGGTSLDADETVLAFQMYLESGSITTFTLIAGNQRTYGNGDPGWTVDGNAGSMGAITQGQWHKLTFDLTLIPGFTPGVTNLNRVAPKPGGSGFVAYMDDVQVVPEPTSLALLGLGGPCLVRRRR